MIYSKTEILGKWSVAKPLRLATAKARMLKLSRNKSRYQEVQKRTGVPWWFIMCLHERESAGDMDTYLGNGEALSQVTHLVPAGRGPFKNFEDGAVDALVHEGFHKITDWSLSRCLWAAEVYNGAGYRQHGVPSPYVWAGTNQYSQGKYSSDGHYDAGLVDQQLGVAVMFQALISLGMLAVSAITSPSQAGSGVVVSPTVTGTNFTAVIIGAALSVLGAQSFGADAIHTIAAFGGPLAVIMGVLNQLHITGGSNANTLNQILVLTQQVTEQAAKLDALKVAPPAQVADVVMAS
jgi:lysozyme family protein